MSTRRGWQATVGELDAVLRHLDVAQGADAQVQDGQLWIRHDPRQPRVLNSGFLADFGDSKKRNIT